jgi:hypothetical protein
MYFYFLARRRQGYGAQPSLLVIKNFLIFYVQPLKKLACQP